MKIVITVFHQPSQNWPAFASAADGRNSQLQFWRMMTSIFQAYKRHFKNSRRVKFFPPLSYWQAVAQDG